MSLHVLKSTKSVLIETKFVNYWFPQEPSWEEIGKSNSKVGEDGRVYKFSQFDTECNLFRYSGNTFTGDVRMKLQQKHRCKLFQRNKCKFAKVKLCGSHEILNGGYNIWN